MTKAICESLWNEISPNACLKEWCKELSKLALQPFDDFAWEMMGHGLVIEHEHPTDLHAFMPLIAACACVPYISLAIAHEDDLATFNDAIRTDQPIIINLEPGHWVSEAIIDDEDRGFPLHGRCDQDFVSKVRKALVHEIFAEVVNRPVVIVVALQQAQQLEEFLRVTGAFDRKIQFPRISRVSHAKALIKTLGENIVDQSILDQLEHVGLILEDDFADMRRRELMVTALKRIAWRQNRKVAIKDLIEILIYGTTEEDVIELDTRTLRESSIHEAGHAVITYLESGCKHAPVYCAVGKRGDMMGVVVRRCESSKRILGQESFLEAVQSIRISLAGRAAEELMFGIMNTTGVAASSDLKEANRIATKLFANWGFPLCKDGQHQIGSNISVVIGKPTDSEFEYIETLVRDFLQEQYQQVFETLRQNKDFLDFVANAIAKQGILLQSEFEELAGEWFSGELKYEVA